jgi:NAD(P)-dependent dehydrogenase (short-subunit alcohol dehydrogenase family)
MADVSLKDTVAIVTGGASGLGRAITIGLANAGAHVIATASQSRDELEALAGAVEREVGKGRVVPSIADVTNDADCKRVVAEAISKFGKLDVLVNNAGRGMKYVDETFLTKPTRFWETAPDTWRMIIDTNVNGPFLMARAAVQHLLAAGWGRIVNISMSYETMKRQGFSPYGPSKAALESETIIWAQDLRDTGITVNALLPGGAVETGMIPDAFPKDMRTKLMRPDIMVPPLLWLASASSDGFTGHRIIAAEWKGEPGQPRDAGWH